LTQYGFGRIFIKGEAKYDSWEDTVCVSVMLYCHGSRVLINTACWQKITNRFEIAAVDPTVSNF
jgi:hypothetical protein